MTHLGKTLAAVKAEPANPAVYVVFQYLPLVIQWGESTNFVCPVGQSFLSLLQFSTA